MHGWVRLDFIQLVWKINLKYIWAEVTETDFRDNGVRTERVLGGVNAIPIFV